MFGSRGISDALLTPATPAPTRAQRATLLFLTAFACLLLGPGFGGPAQAGVDLRQEIECLALNIYHEARGEPKRGRLAVGHVVLNRVADSRFPSSVCEVVRHTKDNRLYRCQFTWWCDGRSDEPRDVEAWRESQALARSVFWGFTEDPTRGALWYHATWVKPLWRKALNRGPRIGDHVFYTGKYRPVIRASN